MRLLRRAISLLTGVVTTVALSLGLAGADSPDCVVTLNEVMYRPLDNQAALTWIELHNQMSVDVDLSHWKLTGDAQFTFPEGTVIPGRGYLVVAASPSALRQRISLREVLGPFTGRLPNAGARIELRNNSGRLMDRVGYGVDDDWPVAPNGAGPSLAKLQPDSASGPPENWTASAQSEGTPGAENFPPNTVPVTSGMAAVAFNELAAASSPNFFVELINDGPTPVELAGYILCRLRSDVQDHPLTRQIMGPGDRLVVRPDELGFNVQSGDRLVLYAPQRKRVLDAVVVKPTLRGRWPEGTGRWLAPTLPTPGGTNAFTFYDAIVINEIMYHHRPLSQAPSRDAPEAWIELFNRSQNPLPLAGWRLDGGIAYEFPADTTIGPGGYLVVAKNVASLRALHPRSPIVGPFKQKLSKRSDRLVLRDARGNPADEVRYFDGGRWPAAADGGGSSLELRNPWADNAQPEAWAPSLERGKSPWVWYTNRAVAKAGPHPATPYHELVIGLLDAGEVLLDDLRVVESPEAAARPLLQNGAFASGLAAWRILGNHHGSIVPDPDNPTNLVLQLTATGPTEYLHNHAETTLKSDGSYVPIMDGRVYEVSFRAQWISGCNLLNTRLWLNRVPKTFALGVPAVNGTPGARNSRCETNSGPTFGRLQHWPVVPPAGQSVRVTVEVQDPQGVQACTVHWSVNGGGWSHQDMIHVSQVFFSNSIPGAAAGAVVQFFVQAVDRLGASSTFPARGRDSRALYQVADGRANLDLAHNLRLVMTAGDTTALFAPTNLLSNEVLGGTAIWDEREVYYDVGLRLKGSAHGRSQAARVGFLVHFNADQLFRGIHKSVGIDRSGGLRFGQEEMLVKHIINHAGGLPGMYDDLIRVITPRPEHTGSALLQMARYGDVFLDSQFELGSEGLAWEYELLYNLRVTTGGPEGIKLPGEDPFGVAGVPLADFGDDQEAYRLNFIIKNHRQADDFSPLMAALKAIGLPAGAVFDAATAKTLDVDEWLRAFALVALIGSGDHYAGDGIPHNVMLYTRPADRKTLFFVCDTDFAFDWGRVPPTSPLTRNADLQKLVRNPANLRRYYWHLLDILSTSANARYLTPWARHYSRFCPGQDFSPGLEYLRQRERYVLSQVPLNIPFAITRPAERVLNGADDRINLTGTAPLDMADIAVTGTNYPVSWTSPTVWSVEVPLAPGTNRFVVQGLNHAGAPMTNAVQTVVVTRKIK